MALDDEKTNPQLKKHESEIKQKQTHLVDEPFMLFSLFDYLDSLFGQDLLNFQPKQNKPISQN